MEVTTEPFYLAQNVHSVLQTVSTMFLLGTFLLAGHIVRTVSVPRNWKAGVQAVRTVPANVYMKRILPAYFFQSIARNK